MANMDTKDGKFILPINVEADGTISKTLNTAGTFVDRNIEIDVSTPDASFEVKDSGTGHNGEVTATASIASNNYTVEKAEGATEDPTRFAITLQADAHVNDVTVGTKVAGFTALDDKTTISAEDATQATHTVYIKEGSLAGSAEVAVTTDGKVELGTAQSTAPATGFYIKADASGSVSADSAGYIDSETSAATLSDTKYYSIATVDAHNKVKEGKTVDDYADIHSGALESGSYLFIEEGYIEASKISLKELVPDGSSVGTDTESPLMYKTAHMYNDDGVLVTGTMDDAVLTNITANDATATIGTVAASYDDEAKSFKVSGTQAITGSTSVGVDTTGYAVKGTTAKTGDISGTATVDAKLDLIAIGANKGDDGKVTPVLNKETGTAKADAEVSTTAPTDKHYVAFGSKAIDAKTTVTPTVTSAGYGDATHNTPTSVDVTRGAEASGTYYIGIDNGAVEDDGSISGADMQPVISLTNTCNDESISLAGIVATQPTSGTYITLSSDTSELSSTVSGTVTTTVTEGYVTSGNGTSKDVSATIKSLVANNKQYIKVFDGSFVG